MLYLEGDLFQFRDKVFLFGNRVCSMGAGTPMDQLQTVSPEDESNTDGEPADTTDNSTADTSSPDGGVTNQVAAAGEQMGAPMGAISIGVSAARASQEAGDPPEMSISIGIASIQTAAEQTTIQYSPSDPARFDYHAPEAASPYFDPNDPTGQMPYHTPTYDNQALREMDAIWQVPGGHWRVAQGMYQNNGNKYYPGMLTNIKPGEPVEMQRGLIGKNPDGTPATQAQIDRGMNTFYSHYMPEILTSQGRDNTLYGSSQSILDAGASGQLDPEFTKHFKIAQDNGYHIASGGPIGNTDEMLFYFSPQDASKDQPYKPGWYAITSQGQMRPYDPGPYFNRWNYGQSVDPKSYRDADSYSPEHALNNSLGAGFKTDAEIKTTKGFDPVATRDRVAKDLLVFYDPESKAINLDAAKLKPNTDNLDEVVYYVNYAKELAKSPPAWMERNHAISAADKQFIDGMDWISQTPAKFMFWDNNVRDFFALYNKQFQDSNGVAKNSAQMEAAYIVSQLPDNVRPSELSYHDYEARFSFTTFFDQSIYDELKSGKYDNLTPDEKQMGVSWLTQFKEGPSWSRISPEAQAALIAAEGSIKGDSGKSTIDWWARNISPWFDPLMKRGEEAWTATAGRGQGEAYRPMEVLGVSGVEPGSPVSGAALTMMFGSKEAAEYQHQLTTASLDNLKKPYETWKEEAGPEKRMLAENWIDWGLAVIGMADLGINLTRGAITFAASAKSLGAMNVTRLAMKISEGIANPEILNETNIVKYVGKQFGLQAAEAQGYYDLAKVLQSIPKAVLNDVRVEELAKDATRARNTLNNLIKIDRDEQASTKFVLALRKKETGGRFISNAMKAARGEEDAYMNSRMTKAYHDMAEANKNLKFRQMLHEQALSDSDALHNDIFSRINRMASQGGDMLSILTRLNPGGEALAKAGFTQQQIDSLLEITRQVRHILSPAAIETSRLSTSANNMIKSWQAQAKVEALLNNARGIVSKRDMLDKFIQGGHISKEGLFYNAGDLREAALSANKGFNGWVNRQVATKWAARLVDPSVQKALASNTPKGMVEWEKFVLTRNLDKARSYASVMRNIAETLGEAGETIIIDSKTGMVKNAVPIKEGLSTFMEDVFNNPTLYKYAGTETPIASGRQLQFMHWVNNEMGYLAKQFGVLFEFRGGPEKFQMPVRYRDAISKGNLYYDAAQVAYHRGESLADIFASGRNIETNMGKLFHDNVINKLSAIARQNSIDQLKTLGMPNYEKLQEHYFAITRFLGGNATSADFAIINTIPDLRKILGDSFNTENLSKATPEFMRYLNSMLKQQQERFAADFTRAKGVAGGIEGTDKLHQVNALGGKLETRTNIKMPEMPKLNGVSETDKQSILDVARKVIAGGDLTPEELITKQRYSDEVEETAKAISTGPKTATYKAREVQPGFEYHMFPPQIAAAIEKSIADRPNLFIQKADQVNSVMRTLETAWDHGMFMVMGGPRLFTNPGAFISAVAHSTANALSNGTTYSKYVTANLPEILNAMDKGGLTFHSSEFLEGMGVFSKIPVFNKVSQFYEHNFYSFVDYLKMEWWKTSYRSNMTTAECAELGKFVEQWTGSLNSNRLGVSNRQQAIESLLMFAPKYARSNMGMWTEWLNGGLSTQLGLSHLMTAVTTDIASYTALCMATGQNPQFDRTKAHFMEVKIGNNYYRAGGGLVANIGLMANMLALIPTVGTDVVTGKFNAVGKHLKDFALNTPIREVSKRFSPMLSLELELATGTTFMGNDVWSPLDFALNSAIPKATPFYVNPLISMLDRRNEYLGNDFLTDILPAMGAEYFGLVSKRETVNDQLRVVKDQSAQAEGYADFRTYQQTANDGKPADETKINQLYQLHPEIFDAENKALQAKAASQGWNVFDTLSGMHDEPVVLLKMNEINAGFRSKCDALDLAYEQNEIKSIREYYEKLSEARGERSAQMKALAASQPEIFKGWKDGKFIDENTDYKDIAYDKFNVIVYDPAYNLPNGEVDYAAQKAAKEAFRQELYAANGAEKGQEIYKYCEMWSANNRGMSPMAATVTNLARNISMPSDNETHGYWDIDWKTPAGKQERLEYRTAHPLVDASLYMLGRVNNLQTTQAADIINRHNVFYGFGISVPDVNNTVDISNQLANIDYELRNLNISNARQCDPYITRMNSELYNAYGNILSMTGRVTPDLDSSQTQAILSSIDKANEYYRSLTNMANAYINQHPDDKWGTWLGLQMERQAIYLKNANNKTSVWR